MADRAPEYPAVADGDTDDVAWALETGRSRWVRDEHQEGVKWLSRAAASAAGAGHDARARALTVKVIELRSWVAEMMHTGVGAGPLTGLQTWVVDDDDGAAAVAITAHLDAAPGGAAPPPPPAAAAQPPAWQQALTPGWQAPVTPPLPARTTEQMPARTTEQMPVRTTEQMPVQAELDGSASHPPGEAALLDQAEVLQVSVQTLAGRPGVYLLCSLGLGELPPAGTAAGLLLLLEPEAHAD